MTAQPPDERTMKTGEALAWNIRRQIATGELRVGDRLPTEDELTETFGVARTTLREALRILESQGLISIRRGRGGGATVTFPDLTHLAEPLAVVLQLRGATMADFDEARSLLEPELAGWLARNHSEEALAVLQAAVARASLAAEANDGVAFGQAAAAMHNALIERGGNTTLSVLSQLLHHLVVDRYVSAAVSADQALMRRAVRSYWKLVTAISDGNAELAKAHWHEQMNWMISESGGRAFEPYRSGPDGTGLQPRD